MFCLDVEVSTRYQPFADFLYQQNKRLMSKLTDRRSEDQRSLVFVWSENCMPASFFVAPFKIKVKTARRLM